MLRKVDLPQPDGPITATNSPGFTSRSTSRSAVVSTSVGAIDFAQMLQRDHACSGC